MKDASEKDGIFHRVFRSFFCRKTVQQMIAYDLHFYRLVVAISIVFLLCNNEFSVIIER